MTRSVHRSLQQRASMREGPADPSVSTADFQMASAVMLSKRTGWKSLSTTSVLKRTSVCGGSGCGCLSLRMSRTVFPDSSTTSFSLNGPDSVALVKSYRAALTFPSIIRLENLRATLASWTLMSLLGQGSPEDIPQSPWDFGMGRTVGL